MSTNDPRAMPPQQIDQMFREILSGSTAEQEVRKMQLTRLEDGLLIARLNTRIAHLEEENFKLRDALQIIADLPSEIAPPSVKQFARIALCGPSAERGRDAGVA